MIVMLGVATSRARLLVEPRFQHDLMGSKRRAGSWSEEHI